jgi:hypothetical protein
MKIGDFYRFIKNSGLSAEEWDQIFDLDAIEQQINRSKKIGTSRHLKSITPLQKIISDRHEQKCPKDYLQKCEKNCVKSFGRRCN